MLLQYILDTNTTALHYFFVEKVIRQTQLFLFPLYKLLAFAMRLRKLKIGNLESSDRVLIVSNHISHFDAFLIVGQFTFKEIREITPLRTVMSNRYLYWNPFSPLLRLLGCFPSKPKRGKIHGLKAAIRYSVNSSLLFFPQGGIEGMKNSTRLRTGAAVVADTTDIPILPIYIQRKGMRFTTVMGMPYLSDGKNITQIMDSVFSLEKHVDK